MSPLKHDEAPDVDAKEVYYNTTLVDTTMLTTAAGTFPASRTPFSAIHLTATENALYNTESVHAEYSHATPSTADDVRHDGINAAGDTAVADDSTVAVSNSMECDNVATAEVTKDTTTVAHDHSGTVTEATQSYATAETATDDVDVPYRNQTLSKITSFAANKYFTADHHKGT